MKDCGLLITTDSLSCGLGGYITKFYIPMRKQNSMSLLHLTIRKYVNFLGRKLIYNIFRGGMAFIILTWAPTQHPLAWATC